MWKLSEELEVGKYLDLMPARGREACAMGRRAPGREGLRAGGERAVAAGSGGSLRLPAELARASRQDAHERRSTEWAAYPGRPRDWCHPSVETTVTRRSRVERLIPEEPTSPPTRRGWRRWSPTDRPAAGVAALRVARSTARRRQRSRRSSYRDAKILLTEHAAHGRSGRLGTVFLTSGITKRDRRRLGTPGGHAPTPARSRFSNDSRSARSIPRPSCAPISMRYRRIGTVHVDWDVFWAMARLLPADEADELLMPIPNFGAASACETRERQVPADLQRVAAGADRAPASDAERRRHGRRRPITRRRLQLLGRSASRPARRPSGGSVREAWFRNYLRRVGRSYLEAIPDDAPHPMPEYLEFAEKTFPGPLSPLAGLNTASRRADDRERSSASKTSSARSGT